MRKRRSRVCQSIYDVDEDSLEINAIMLFESEIVSIEYLD